MLTVSISLHAAFSRAAQVVMVKWVSAICGSLWNCRQAVGTELATQARVVHDL